MVEVISDIENGVYYSSFNLFTHICLIYCTQSYCVNANSISNSNFKILLLACGNSYTFTIVTCCWVCISPFCAGPYGDYKSSLAGKITRLADVALLQHEPFRNRAEHLPRLVSCLISVQKHYHLHQPQIFTATDGTQGLIASCWWLCNFTRQQ